MATYILIPQDRQWAFYSPTSQFVLMWFPNVEHGIRVIKGFLQKEKHKLIIPGAKGKYKRSYNFPLTKEEFDGL